MGKKVTPDTIIRDAILEHPIFDGIENVVLRPADDIDFQLRLMGLAASRLHVDYGGSEDKETAVYFLTELIEVVLALGEVHGVSRDTMIDIVERKYFRHGGFSKRLILESYEIPDNTEDDLKDII